MTLAYLILAATTLYWRSTAVLGPIPNVMQDPNSHSYGTCVDADPFTDGQNDTLSTVQGGAESNLTCDGANTAANNEYRIGITCSDFFSGDQTVAAQTVTVNFRCIEDVAGDNCEGEPDVYEWTCEDTIGGNLGHTNGSMAECGITMGNTTGTFASSSVTVEDKNRICAEWSFNCPGDNDICDTTPFCAVARDTTSTNNTNLVFPDTTMVFGGVCGGVKGGLMLQGAGSWLGGWLNEEPPPLDLHPLLWSLWDYARSLPGHPTRRAQLQALGLADPPPPYPYDPHLPRNAATIARQMAAGAED